MSKTHAKTIFCIHTREKAKSPFRKKALLPPPPPPPPQPRQVQLCRWERRFRGPNAQKTWDPLRCRDVVVVVVVGGGGGGGGGRGGRGGGGGGGGAAYNLCCLERIRNPSGDRIGYLQSFGKCKQWFTQHLPHDRNVV